jgi:hypothetical protein
MSSISGRLYQPNLLPLIGVASCAQWAWSVSPWGIHGKRTLMRPSFFSSSLFWQTMP